MALVNPQLQTAVGSTCQLALLAKGALTPPQVVFTAGATAVGATSVTVTVDLPATVTTFTIKNGTYLLADEQVVIIDGDQTITGTTATLVVDPLEEAITAATIMRTYVGILPVVGLEAANRQLTKETNQAVLLSSRGWQNRAYSTGSWQLSGNLYAPVDRVNGEAARRIVEALIDERFVYVERFLSDGEYSAGLGIVTDASDTVTGASFITRSLTIQGSGKLRTAPEVVNT